MASDRGGPGSQNLCSAPKIILTPFPRWQANFQAYIDAHYGEFGLPSDVPVRVKVARIDWDKAYGDHTAARQANVAQASRL